MAQDQQMIKKHRPPDTHIFGRVGYGYVPYQEYGEIYSPEEALRQGTIFPILDIDWNAYVPRLDRRDR